MGRSRQKKQRPGGAVMLARAERELAKGNVKEALKEVKNCYRSDPTPECRTLLERAYVDRVEQLHKMQMTAEARAVLRDLLELKPTTGEVQGAIPRLQLLVGDSAVDPAEMFARDPALLVEMVDQVMVDPQASPPNVATISQQVQQVRAALTAVERGEDEQAAELLRDIPRTSPLADWKLLIRGLSAFYQADSERAAENWKRLDAARPAARIANTLRAAAGESLDDASLRSVAQSRKRLDAWSQSESLLPSLKRLAASWQSGEWRQFFQEFRRLRQRCETSRPEILESLVDMTWKRAIREEDERMLEELERCAPPPPLDPQWRRAQAMLQVALREDIEYTVQCWELYAKSLASSAALRDDERSDAVALVELRIARLQLSVADDFDESGAEELLSHSRMLVESARHHLQAAIRHCPRLLNAYRDLSYLHDRFEEPEKSAIVLHRLLEQSPDDYDAHVRLARLYLELEDPSKSEPHIQAIARLRPRGEETSILRWSHTLAMVRALTKRGQCEAARQELANVASNVPASVPPYVIPTISSSIEWKAGNAPAAERFIDEALATVGGPAIIWMQMAMLAARMSLPVKLRKDFNESFKKAIKAKPTSEAVGHLSRALAQFRASDFKYTGRATHERLVVDYLKRTKRMRWEEDDLKRACMFLEQMKAEELRKELVAKGQKKFRRNPYFQIWAAVDDYRATTRRTGDDPYDTAWRLDELINRVALALENARQLSPPDEALVEAAEHLLGMIEEARRFCFSMPPSFLMDSEEYDDDEDEESYPAGPSGFPSAGSIAAMFRTAMSELDPEAAEDIEQAAASQGITPEESFLEFFANEIGASYDPSPSIDEEQTSRRSKRRRK